MSSCLGIYVDKNLIKYAKLKKTRDTFKIESYNVEVFENLEDALNKIVVETNSSKDAISINISNELYNYFDVFSELTKKDITTSLDIEFEMLCEKKGYNKSLLESRYLLMDNKENYEKYKAIYISANKNDLNKKIRALSNFKLSSMSTVLTSITNLIDSDEKEDFAIINIENEIGITTVIDGQISRVDILSSGLEKILEEINKEELSWKKAYDVFKNIIIYNEEVQSLDEDENQYIDIIMPEVEKIAKEVKKVLGSFKEKVSKLYITGMGATISNIDLYFQEALGLKCEILKPFFVDTNSLKNPIKEYIEVNSAIALALDGLGFINKDLNFAPTSKFENVDNIIKAKEEFSNFGWKEMLKRPLNIEEKLLVRGIAFFLIFAISYAITSGSVYKNLNKQKNNAINKIKETNEQLTILDNEQIQIDTFTSTYSKLIDSVGSVPTDTSKDARIIAKDSIPNLLNKIMFVIPQKVQITSIKNTEKKHIVIEAVSEKYEQLGFFSGVIKTDGLLTNVQSSSGEKTDSLVKITIEGDLP